MPISQVRIHKLRFNSSRRIVKVIAGHRHQINRITRLLVRRSIMGLSKQGKSKGIYIQIFIRRMLQAIIRLQGQDLRKSRLRNLELEWLIVLTCIVKTKTWQLIDLKVRLDHHSKTLHLLTREFISVRTNLIKT